MINQHEEQDEADQSEHKGQEAKEETFARANAIRLGISRHLAAGHAHPVVVLTMESETTIYQRLTINDQRTLRSLLTDLGLLPMLLHMA